jgi:hypothetical protein
MNNKPLSRLEQIRALREAKYERLHSVRPKRKAMVSAPQAAPPKKKGRQRRSG